MNSTKRRTTKWLPGTMKPTQIGVYQRDYRNARGDRAAGITFSYWTGEYWGLYGETEEAALRWKGHVSSYQSLPWRGLASAPKEQQP